ncbi:hypothetical protein Tsumi_14720 [Porphyromonas miyakawae]|uniref:DUF4294 domain-containing protein n=1 Tax=Porphyromonas miyakawae TaxID=3137470 RepID=A0ABQ0E3V3_9PORP
MNNRFTGTFRAMLTATCMLFALSFRMSAANPLPDEPDSLIVNPHGAGFDTTYVYALPNVTVVHHWSPKYAPLTTTEKSDYWRRIRDVKIVLPYAEMISTYIIETYEYLERLPNKRARRKHLKVFEKELMETYKPVMKKLTLRQGKLLIKLVDRETNSTGYEIIKAFYGPFKAFWYGVFAEFYGGDLHVKYDPRYNADDALTERIIYLLQHHLL